MDGRRSAGEAGETVIAKLASVEERFLAVNIRSTREFHHGLFWMGVDEKLDNLGCASDARRRIETEIAKTVPRPGAQWALWGVTCIPRYDP
jgi:hypothetical protein